MNLKLTKALPFLAFLLFFAVPVSTSLKTILLPIIFATIILDANLRFLLVRAFKNKYLWAMFLFVAFAFLECFRGQADFSEKTAIMLKYSKLLYLPLFAVLLHNKACRAYALNGFLLAMLVTVIFAFIKVFNNPTVDYIFRNHIMTGHMAAFAAYLCLLRASEGKKYYWLLALLFYYQIFFLSIGRTGPIIAFILFLLWSLQYCSLYKALVMLFLVALFAIFSYVNHGVLYEKITRSVSEVHSYKNENADTSIGYRLQFHEFSHKLWQREPILGIGLGGFTHAFATEKPVASWDRRLLEPHSQYWLILTEQGLFGLFLYILMLVSFVLISLKAVKTKSITLAMLLIFSIGNFSDSLLLYSGSGYFFLMMFSLSLGELL